MKEKRSKEGYSNKISYIKEYTKENYQQINLTVKKGMKEIYKEYATSQGFNLSEFFITAANYYISTHTAQNGTEQAEKE